MKCVNSDGCTGKADRVTEEGLLTVGRVACASGTIFERVRARSGVVPAGRIAKECIGTVCRVLEASCVEYQRGKAGRRVAAAGCVA